MNKRKSILVTSGSKRLGKHISKFFVMNDWDLILHYNNSKVEAEETANELSMYSKIHSRSCNLLNHDTIQFLSCIISFFSPFKTMEWG